VDAHDGYVRGVHTAPAHQSETRHFEASINSADFKPARADADKRLASRANRTHLHQHAIKILPEFRLHSVQGTADEAKALIHRDQAAIHV
jgi:hypothetical protein